MLLFPTRVRKTRFSYCRLPAINSILYSHGKSILQLLHNFSGKWNKGFTVPAGYKNSIIPRWTPLYHDELYYTTVWKLEWHSFFALLVGKLTFAPREICVSFFYCPCWGRSLRGMKMKMKTRILCSFFQFSFIGPYRKWKLEPKPSCGEQSSSRVEFSSPYKSHHIEFSFSVFRIIK